MAEQPPENKHQEIAGAQKEEAQHTETDHKTVRDGDEQEEADNVQDVNLQQPEACTISAEETIPAVTEESPSQEDEKKQTGEESSTQTQAEEKGQGDCKRETQGNKPQTLEAEECAGKSHSGETEAQEMAPLQDDTMDDHTDDPKERPDEELEDIGSTTTEKEEDGVSCPEQDMTPEEGKKEEEEEEAKEMTEHVGILHGGNIIYVMGVIAVGLAILVYHFYQLESLPQEKDEQQIDIFLRHMEKVKTQFPNQRAEVWKRSRIHLLRHLQTPQPTEPVSLILTAGLRAEKTLHCLAHSLASAFSSALNASVLHIDGASKASQDSDQVKLDIDRNLQGAFEGDKPVAVIHRFEELPPGSTLIFYRYCDHENAAYKKTFLIFTVLLGEEEEIPATSHLRVVEEMVDDHLQKKFLSDDFPVSYDRMDQDKYSGLWSRISHLILPVAAVERIEHKGC
ncbi:torsin-1A-interacting protein 2-like [Xyrichtys novacula]|uniref:Torsin-1A-interacting protein 2-like n=1 Tax=Xyrichtys novacula TaxID=13765 RepID=A0AAV1FJ82_XYRNO|nr:torsin-1A-interacting protein 2-like [Xyrichtys novacula]